MEGKTWGMPLYIIRSELEVFNLVGFLDVAAWDFQPPPPFFGATRWIRE